MLFYVKEGIAYIKIHSILAFHEFMNLTLADIMRSLLVYKWLGFWYFIDVLLWFYVQPSEFVVEIL